jgi:hypothetical protein
MDRDEVAEGQKSMRRRTNGEGIHTSKREETEIGGDKQRRGKGCSESANTPSEDSTQKAAPPSSPKRSKN